MPDVLEACLNAEEVAPDLDSVSPVLTVRVDSAVPNFYNIHTCTCGYLCNNQRYRFIHNQCLEPLSTSD